MNRLMIATVLVASAAGLAQAIDFTGSLAPSQWSTSFESTSWGSPSVTQDTLDSINFNYDFNGNSDAWYASIYTNFGVVAGSSATISFDYDYSGFHSWYLAYAQLWTFVDGPDGRAWAQWYTNSEASGGFSATGSITLDINQGYMWGVTPGGGHYDSNLGMVGTVKLSNLVPAPGAATLAGLGALTITSRRRR